jgi:hypothetical protein
MSALQYVFRHADELLQYKAELCLVGLLKKRFHETNCINLEDAQLSAGAYRRFHTSNDKKVRASFSRG